MLVTSLFVCPLPAALQGLDPASRRNLWDVVKNNKRNRAIVLTTHSMEEAEMLCDRLGIFVDGRLVCIGNPKEITSRYGGFLVSKLMLLVEQWLVVQFESLPTERFSECSICSMRCAC
eukprot:GHUV01033351.1.p2 GENE.GHUV01033351.1~~GHUV01033351.1.p2  ORF type:complete len:118 (-),score=14.57 GHUV01033351.1:234-587(-)